MISYTLPSTRQIFCWLFLVMILSFGIGGILLFIDSGKAKLNRDESSDFRIPYDGIETVRMNLNVDTGTINISGGSMEHILSGKVRADTKQYLPRLTHVTTNKTLYASVDRHSDLLHEMIGGEEKWDIRLGNQTPMSLLISVGTGDIHVAPGDAQISELALESGAGSIFLNITAWKGKDLPIRIENGAGDITVLFPDKSHVSVSLDRALGNLFLTGFSGDAHGYYHTTDKPDAPVIHVTISQGLGDVTLRTENPMKE